MIQGSDGHQYIVIRNYAIQLGGLKDKQCDVAFMHAVASPYVFPSAIHTKPHLLPMDMNNVKIKTQKSSIGSDWQYWSRRLDHQPTPKNIVTHIATIFRDVEI